MTAATTPRLVWAVEWGEYEQRDIVAVFATRKQAEQFVEVCNGREPLWAMSLSHRPLQLAETNGDIGALWPLSGDLPEVES